MRFRSGLVAVLLAVMLLCAGCASPAASPPASAQPGVPVPSSGPLRSFQPAPVRSPAADGPALSGGQDGVLPPIAAGQDVSGSRPFVPARLTLPSGRQAVVVSAETGTDGALAVPVDPAQVGWWTGGARPGDPYGSIVLAGHIDSRRFGIGVLAEAAVARPGQVVRLSAGGSSRGYRVESVRRVPKARLAADTDVFDQSGAPRLVLVTCGGKFDPRTRTYADNVIVVAVPVV